MAVVVGAVILADIVVVIGGVEGLVMSYIVVHVSRGKSIANTWHRMAITWQ